MRLDDLVRLRPNVFERVKKWRELEKMLAWAIDEVKRENAEGENRSGALQFSLELAREHRDAEYRSIGQDVVLELESEAQNQPEEWREPPPQKSK